MLLLDLVPLLLHFMYIHTSIDEKYSVRNSVQYIVDDAMYTVDGNIMNSGRCHVHGGWYCVHSGYTYVHT